MLAATATKDSNSLGVVVFVCALRYRNKALGSDYEDEMVLQAVVEDDVDDPYAVLMRNTQHEAKVKDWQSMSAQQKCVRGCGSGANVCVRGCGCGCGRGRDVGCVLCVVGTGGTRGNTWG